MRLNRVSHSHIRHGWLYFLCNGNLWRKIKLLNCQNNGGKSLNPLSTNHEYIRYDTVVTSESSGHSQNYEKKIDIFVQELEIFYKMAYKTFYFDWSIPEKLRYKLKFSIFNKKRRRRRLDVIPMSRCRHNNSSKWRLFNVICRLHCRGYSAL